MVVVHVEKALGLKWGHRDGPARETRDSAAPPVFVDRVYRREVDGFGETVEASVMPWQA